MSYYDLEWYSGMKKFPIKKIRNWLGQFYDLFSFFWNNFFKSFASFAYWSQTSRLLIHNLFSLCVFLWLFFSVNVAKKNIVKGDKIWIKFELTLKIVFNSKFIFKLSKKKTVRFLAVGLNPVISLNMMKF